MHGVGSRNKLTPTHARLYPGDSLLDVAGRAICAAGGLPRKELHEAWEAAQRIRAHHDGGGRIVDLCCGFGLLAQLLLVVDPRFTHAVAVDRRLPPNHARIHAALVGAFPGLAGRVAFVASDLDDVPLSRDDLVVSVHACGPLTDAVLARAVDAGARAAVLPCCHRYRFRDDLRGHADPSAAIDDERCARLQALGYDVVVDAIPIDVSPKNRLLWAVPRATVPAAHVVAVPASAVSGSPTMRATGTAPLPVAHADLRMAVDCHPLLGNVFEAVSRALDTSDGRADPERAADAVRRVLTALAKKLRGVDTHGWPEQLIAELCGPGPLEILLADRTVRAVHIDGVRVFADRGSGLVEHATFSCPAAVDRACLRAFAVGPTDAFGPADAGEHIVAVRPTAQGRSVRATRRAHIIVDDDDAPVPPG